MKQIYALFSLQMQTLVMFAMFLAFIYFPNQNTEINFLPFQISSISWRVAWYYIVLFGLLWIFVFLRVSLLKSLETKVSFRNLVISNVLVASFSLFFLFVPMFSPLSLLMLLLGLLLILIDGAYYYWMKKMPFITLVFVLFVFVNVILVFVCWQEDYKRWTYSSNLVEYCRTDRKSVV